MANVVGVRFNPVTKVYYFDPNGATDLLVDDRVIVETARGIEMGLDDKVIDEVSIFLAKNAPEVTQILRGIKPLKADETPLKAEEAAPAEKPKKKAEPEPVAEKPIAKKPEPKPVVEKPAAKKPEPKPVVEKPAAKKPEPKPVVEKPAEKGIIEFTVVIVAARQCFGGSGAGLQFASALMQRPGIGKRGSRKKRQRRAHALAVQGEQA